MTEKLFMYGLDNPYWFYVSIVSAIVMFASDFKKLWLIGVIFILIAILTVLKTARKFQIINTLLSDQALLPAKNALDVSVGTGYSTTRLARAALNAKVTGIEDAYQHTANRARNNLFKRQVSSRANVISADITKMPFDSDSFDVITGSYSKQTQLFTHSRKQRQAICDEIYRLVKKDGSGSILMVNTRRQINKYAVLFSSKPELDVYIADPEMRIKFGYRAMKIIVR